MRTLDLVVKPAVFESIRSGERKTIVREVTPQNAKRLVQMDEDEMEIEDEDGNSLPVPYEAIRFRSGFHKEAPTVTVAVTESHSEIFTEIHRWEDGSPMMYRTDENGNLGYFKVDIENDDGDDIFARDGSGNLVPTTADDEDGLPFRYPQGEGVEEGIGIEYPLEYEHNGKTWFKEQVVFTLGDIIG